MSIKIKYEGKSDEKFLDKLGSNKVGGSGGGGGSSAPSDWNAYEGEPGHVLNRTHYEEVTTVGGDTLTWDGNTEGLLSVSISGGAMAFKVSDLTPSPDEMPNGLVFRMSSGSEQEMPKEVVQGSFDAYGAIIGGMFIIYSDNHTFEGMATFPKAGIYFSVIEDEYGFERAVSLTIPGYTGFTTTTTEIKTLDPKYLPEALQFGEDKAFEPIVWDGNTEGLENLAGMPAYKVSDFAPSLNELVNGGTIEYTAQGNKVKTTFTAADIDTSTPNILSINDEDGAAQGTVVMVVVADTELAPNMIAKTGTYFMGMSNLVTHSLIPNATVKPLDEKYMPILTSPSGKKFKITVDDSGTLSAAEVTE